MVSEPAIADPALQLTMPPYRPVPSDDEIERAAAMLRLTDNSVAEICFSVGLQSVGSFTSSFTRTYGVSPSSYRVSYPPAAGHAMVPTCVLRAYARPQRSTFGEDSGAGSN